MVVVVAAAEEGGVVPDQEDHLGRVAPLEASLVGDQEDVAAAADAAVGAVVVAAAADLAWALRFH